MASANDGSETLTENLNRERVLDHAPSSNDVSMREADDPVPGIQPQMVQLPQQASEEEKALEQQYENLIHEVESCQEKTSIRDFTKLKRLGEGSYGVVLLVKHKKTEKYYQL